jgi:DNA-cytosine methyltransferase
MMNVLSLFDGMSCGRIALERAGINVTSYHASELDKYAIQVTQANWPETVQLGDVTQWREWDIDWSGIDLLIGGSPCQGFSFAGKQLAFDDPRSKLFFVYVDILNHIKSLNPDVKFMLENVRMKKESLAVISEHLGVEPVFINSASVSAQNRNRYYWANWKIEQPEDKGVLLADILEDYNDNSVGVAVRLKSKCLRVGGRNSPLGSKQEWDSPFQRISKKGVVKKGIKKSGCLTGGANSGGNHSDMDLIHSQTGTKRYSITECERLQTIPDGYAQNKGVSNSQCYKMIGNSWTVDVIVSNFKQGLFL